MTYDLGPLGQQTALSATLLLAGFVSVVSVLFTVTKVLLSIYVLPGKQVCLSPSFLSTNKPMNTPPKPSHMHLVNN